MHARTRKTRRRHSAQTRALHERDPPLINLPIPLPVPIPSIPILGPLLSPLIGGLPWPTPTSSTVQTTSPPAAEPTTTTPLVPTVISTPPPQPTSTADAPSPTGSGGDDTGSSGPSPDSVSGGGGASSDGDGSGSSSGSTGTSGDGSGSGSSSSVGGSDGSGDSAPANSGDGTGSGDISGNGGSTSSVSAGADPVAGSSQSSAPAQGAGTTSSSLSGPSGSSAQASGNAQGSSANASAAMSGGLAAGLGVTTTAVPMAVANAFSGSTDSAYTYAFVATSSTGVADAAATAAGTTVGGSTSKGSGSSGSGSSNPDGNGSSSSSSTPASTHHGLSSGAIAAIVVVLVLLFFLLVIVLLRRRSVTQRVRRRRNWLVGGQNPHSGISSSRYFSDHPNGSTTHMSQHSSFGPATSHAPWETFNEPVAATAEGSAPSSRVELSVPPVGRQMTGLTEPVWTSHLNGSIVFAPSVASVAASDPLPTIRSPERTSWGSHHSYAHESSGEGDDAGWVSCPESAAVSTRSHGLPSSMTVRPFSPSEAWQFPKPPGSRADADDAPLLPDDRRRSRVVSPESMFESGVSSEYATAPENPFADHAAEARTVDVDARTSESVDAETAMHFARVETIRRPFVPAMEDEMGVVPGECVRMLRRFNDGWAYAEKVGTRRKGIIPIDCLRTPGEDLPAFLAAKRLSSYRPTSVHTKSEDTGGSNAGVAI
ncbi:uncharacterized protein B0H18DRAFT_313110 [Fomitopsis serialis]|uniref:uncharacterized protein n=1 Tax=Fomitopsis serialis TaxID=139415 RepID=UPI002007E120|nr:uncharacterized protein B0H18DRAFT_313110 [Neoantrodia serialis]KAH9936127.1 hypothetical protein B0H18DRAFT_313110 [Neoantrodia serialis]